jgi:hypothetical protein
MLSWHDVYVHDKHFRHLLCSGSQCSYFGYNRSLHNVLFLLPLLCSVLAKILDVFGSFACQRLCTMRCFLLPCYVHSCCKDLNVDVLHVTAVICVYNAFFCFRPSSGLSNVLNAHGGRKKLQTANCGASHHHEPAPFVTWHDARLVTFCNFDPGQTCR